MDNPSQLMIFMNISHPGGSTELTGLMTMEVQTPLILRLTTCIPEFPILQHWETGQWQVLECNQMICEDWAHLAPSPSLPVNPKPSISPTSSRVIPLIQTDSLPLSLKTQPMYRRSSMDSTAEIIPA